MKLTTSLACLITSLASLAGAIQYQIPVVEQDTQYALSKNPNHTWVPYSPARASQAQAQAQASPHFNNDASTSFWLETISQSGVAPYAGSGYQTFRNVKNFGAKGDGVTDDTAAIQQAIASGNRCGQGCTSSTTTPATVYFPAGTYLISSPIFDYYYTNLIGNPNSMPTLKASSNFNGGYLIDGDPYFTSNQNWGSTNVFYRQVRNFIFDTTAVAAGTSMAGIHWPTAQATSLQNIVFNLNNNGGTQHKGVFIENGSAGFITDLTINGGLVGLAVGNQQFTIRNVNFNNVQTAISHYWDWSFTYTGLTIQNCQVGIDITAGGSSDITTGSITLIDSNIFNTPIAIKTPWTGSSSPTAAASLALENVYLNNVPVAVQNNGGTALAGTSGQTTISAWGQGSKYTASGSHSRTAGASSAFPRPSTLLGSNGQYYTRSKPQYANLAVSSFYNVRNAGATGNGNTDDTAALQKAINTATSAGQVVYIDAGVYKVSSTIQIPPGATLVGESYPVILGSGSNFNSPSSPQAVIQIGTSGQSGHVELSDMIISTQGASPGAVLIQWNLASSNTNPSGMWDVHTRVGGFQGSNLQASQCPTTPNSNSINYNCIGAFMHMHVTTSASGLYMENNWLWTADHDIDNSQNTQVTVYSGRGLYVESSTGNMWLYGTAVEHSTLYQYQFANTQNIMMGYIQTETPYYQPNPQSTLPFSPPSTALNDPNFSNSCSGQSGNCEMAWGLRIISSNRINIYGAGLYSFYNNYSTSCSANNDNACQDNIFSIEGSSSNINVYNLNTVGTQNMIVKNGNSVVATASPNLNAFSDTIALYMGP